MGSILFVHSSNTPDGKFAACVASLVVEGHNRRNASSQHINLKFFPSTYRRGANPGVNGFDHIRQDAFDTAVVIGYPITVEELEVLSKKVRHITYADYRQPSDDVAAVLAEIEATVAIGSLQCASELVLEWLLPVYSESVNREYVTTAITSAFPGKASRDEVDTRFNSILSVLRTHTLYGGDENSDIAMMMFNAANRNGSRGLWAELLVMQNDVWVCMMHEARIKYSAIQDVINGAIHAGPTYIRELQEERYEIKVAYAHQPHMAMTLRQLAKQKQTAFGLVYTNTPSGGVKCMITATDEFKHLVKPICEEFGGGANDRGVGGFDFSTQADFFVWLT